MYTPYQSKYWAAALTCKGAAGSIDSLSRSIASAKVDLNPHQVDAALFAIRSPLSKGVILADEVGLGKTIEAGLVLSQTWAERRRRLLVIVPATLRKQWQQELLEKFALPSAILESQTHAAARRAGNPTPFEPKNQVVICSYHFAAARSAEVQAVKWDLVVIDEAHRLRNIYKRTNKIAAAVAAGIGNSPKILMTATPLQNSLIELYGLVSIIDPQVFGDLFSFREQFLKNGSEDDRNHGLKERLKAVCTRTLRKQVLEYIRFTQRVPMTQDFLPSDDEQRLYDLVSSYLQRDILFALPASQRSLLTLVLRKLLASSTFAIAGTLHSLIHRLQAKDAAESALTEEDFEAIDELADEWEGEDTAEFDLKHSPDLLRKEMEELQRYAGIADAIKRNSKGDALLSVLETALAKAVALGAARKAVVFTESRRTQRYPTRETPDMSDSMRELEPEYGGLRDKVHQLWKADQESEPAPAELFHYTSAEAFQNILKNKTLWASEALSMNDPTEGIHPGGFVRDRLTERKDFIPQKILDLFTDQSLTQILDSQIFVASFCDSGDVLGQWRAYARDGRGYAIGFSPSMLLDGISVVAGLARVEYDAQKLRALAREIIDYAIGVVDHSNMGGEEAERYWGHVANFLIQSLMRFKNPAFREEREWRMICLPAPSLVKFRVVGTRLVPYIHLPVPLDAIRTIRLGPRYTSRDNRVVHSFLRSIGLRNVSVENSVVPLS